MQKRSLAMYIILSLVTCGIFALYWFYTIADDFDKQTEHNKVGTSPGVSLLLLIVTCGIYGWYCFYKWGQATPELLSRYGTQGDDKGVLYLVLSILQLDIINMALIQDDINKAYDSSASYYSQPQGATSAPGYGTPQPPSYPTPTPPPAPTYPAPTPGGEQASYTPQPPPNSPYNPVTNEETPENNTDNPTGL